jgi:hypothetical protein
MSSKRVAKKKVAKTAAKKAPHKKVLKKKGSRKTAAAKPLPKVSPRKATRGDEAEDDQASADAPDPHERVEPRELSHDRLLNPPEETATPLPDEDPVDDVAADAEALEGSTVEEYA